MSHTLLEQQTEGRERSGAGGVLFKITVLDDRFLKLTVVERYSFLL